MALITKWTLLLSSLGVLFLCSSNSDASDEHIEVAFKSVTLKDVCANRQVPIISVADARRLIGELIQEPDMCPESFRQSLYELSPVLALEKGQRLCGEAKFKQIAEYHFRYINPKQETYRTGDDLDHLNKVVKKRPLTEEKFDYSVQLDDYKQEIMIPISLQQFFKAWALQVSGLCKRALVDNLERAIQTLLYDTELDLIDRFVKIGPQVMDPITKSPTNELKFSTLVYMPELEGFRGPNDDVLHAQTTQLDLTKEPELNVFMHACRDRFRPIYSKLILPVVRLAKLGYDYVGPRIDDISDTFTKDSQMLKWLALTSVCEYQGKVELIEPEIAPIKMIPIDYEPMINYVVDDPLWIRGAEALRRELQRIEGKNSTGLKRILFNAGVSGRKALALLDPHRFAWYRRNQNTLSSFLNSASIGSNALSIGVSLAG